MKITLDANPSDAPGCVKIVAENGQDQLIQTDWDYPAVASVFGFSLASVQSPGRGREVEDTDRTPCQHRSTDGTVRCPDCGIEAGQFVHAAREWIDDHDGAEAEDPGYFE